MSRKSTGECFPGVPPVNAPVNRPPRLPQEVSRPEEKNFIHKLKAAPPPALSPAEAGEPGQTRAEEGPATTEAFAAAAEVEAETPVTAGAGLIPGISPERAREAFEAAEAGQTRPHDEVFAELRGPAEQTTSETDAPAGKSGRRRKG